MASLTFDLATTPLRELNAYLHRELTDADRARIEDEFAAAEAYQEQWREEEKKHPRDTII